MLNTLPLTVAVIISQRSNTVARKTRQLKVAAETCTADSDDVHPSVFWRSARKIAVKRVGQNEFGIPFNPNDPPRQREFKHINIRALKKKHAVSSGSSRRATGRLSPGKMALRSSGRDEIWLLCMATKRCISRSGASVFMSFFRFT
jgi:hypothetical protein